MELLQSPLGALFYFDSTFGVRYGLSSVLVLYSITSVLLLRVHAYDASPMHDAVVTLLDFICPSHIEEDHSKQTLSTTCRRLLVLR